MKKETLKKFRKKLESEKKNLLFNDKVVREDFLVNQDERFDELDQASVELEQGMRLRLRNREIFLLKKLDDALLRIDNKTFGQCDACEEDIEIRRLEARPTTTFCLSCKEDQERIENITADGRKPKSLGVSITGRI